VSDQCIRAGEKYVIDLIIFIYILYNIVLCRDKLNYSICYYIINYNIRIEYLLKFMYRKINLLSEKYYKTVISV